MRLFRAEHYKVIARAIDTSRIPERPTLIRARQLIELLSYYFDLDNPRFNPDSFRKACGEQPTEH